MSTKIDFGVQSYCFRHFKDNKQVAGMVKEIGLEKIEVCAVHADFSDVDGFKDIVKTYHDAGVSIVSIGVQTFQGNDSEEKWFECIKAAGASHISAHLRIDSYEKAIAKMRKWCREYDVKIGLHCHGGYMFGGSPDELTHLVGLGGPEIGICIDTAWCMQIGPRQGNPTDWVKKFGKSIHGVHFKDFVFEKNAQWVDVVVGEGNLDLPGFVQALGETGFDGMAVLEYEADVENPVPALKRCVESMRATLG